MEPKPDKLTFQVELQPEGVYVATCEQFPELLVECETEEEALAELVTAYKLAKYCRRDKSFLLEKIGAGK